MAAAEGIVEVHDLHIWTIIRLALSAHVLVGRHGCHSRRRELEELLTHEYGISHTTLRSTTWATIWLLRPSASPRLD